MYNKRINSKNYNVYDLLQDIKNKDKNENIKKIDNIIKNKTDETIEMNFIEKNKINIPNKLKVIGRII